MPNHYNYRFAGERAQPTYNTQDKPNGFAHRGEQYYRQRRDHFPWWLLPFLLDSKESKEYK